jgi:hypothetical protein
MKEARADGAVGFDNGGYPGSVAPGRYRLDQAKVRPEMMDDAPQFLRCFEHKSVMLRQFVDQPFNLVFQYVCLLYRQSYRRLARRRPSSRAIEGRRRQVHSQKRYPLQTQSLRRFHGFAQERDIPFLYRGPRSHGKVGLKRIHLPKAGGQELESPTDPADTIVSLRRTIQGHDHVVEAVHDA